MAFNLRLHRRRVAKTKTFSAPVRGLNASESLALMDPADALVLENVICRPGYLEARKGYIDHVTGFAAQVETLFSYTGTTGTPKLFAAANTAIYDVTTTGALGAAVITGLTSAYWSQTQISNQAGNFLIAVNGQDDGRIYNGTTWSLFSPGGISSALLSHVTVWKRRVWMVEEASFRAWYLAADAISGAATSFNFSGVFKRGGRLLSLLTWSLDGGEGVGNDADDYLLAVTSVGEVAVYKGTDPSSASTFALVGVYFVGAPIGERYYAHLGGDLALLTTEGIISATKFTSIINKRSNLTYRIQDTILRDIATYGAVKGWEVHVFRAESLLLIHVPGENYQWVMSTLTGAWSKLLYTASRTWATIDTRVFSGGLTTVFQNLTTGTDRGSAITWTVVPAFTYMRSPTTPKHFTLGRLALETDALPAIQQRLLVDFNLDLANLTPTGTPGATGARWGSALWGRSLWGAASNIAAFRPWHTLNGVGYSATQAIRGTSLGVVNRLVAIDYVYEEGGGL